MDAILFAQACEARIAAEAAHAERAAAALEAAEAEAAHKRVAEARLVEQAAAAVERERVAAQNREADEEAAKRLRAKKEAADASATAALMMNLADALQATADEKMEESERLRAKHVDRMERRTLRARRLADASAVDVDLDESDDDAVEEVLVNSAKIHRLEAAQ